jgi:hypothetical protein
MNTGHGLDTTRMQNVIVNRRWLGVFRDLIRVVFSLPSGQPRYFILENLVTPWKLVVAARRAMQICPNTWGCVFWPVGAAAHLARRNVTSRFPASFRWLVSIS